MSQEPILHGDPIGFTDGASVGVESVDGFVHLITRDAQGVLVAGVEFAPSEAQQLGQNLLAAAFVANPDAGAGA